MTFEVVIGGRVPHQRGAELAAARAAVDVSVRRAAEELGTSVIRLHFLENGLADFSRDWMWDLAIGQVRRIRR